jgi:hypothetical protein
MYAAEEHALSISLEILVPLKEIRGFSPQANNSDQVTTAYR